MLGSQFGRTKHVCLLIDSNPDASWLLLCVLCVWNIIAQWLVLDLLKDWLVLGTG